MNYGVCQSIVRAGCAKRLNGSTSSLEWILLGTQITRYCIGSLSPRRREGVRHLSIYFCHLLKWLWRCCQAGFEHRLRVCSVTMAGHRLWFKFDEGLQVRRVCSTNFSYGLQSGDCKAKRMAAFYFYLRASYAASRYCYWRRLSVSLCVCLRTISKTIGREIDVTW